MLSDIRDVNLWICRDGINTMISSIPRTSLCRGCFCFYHNRKQLVLGTNCLMGKFAHIEIVFTFNPNRHTRRNRFCLLFNNNLTFWVPFPTTNRSSCRKNSILAKVCFDAKRGLLVHKAKWIFISMTPHLHQILGYLLQNVVRFAAKWRAICR